MALVTLAGIILIGRRFKQEVPYREISDAYLERCRYAHLEIDAIDTGNRKKPHRLIPLNGQPLSVKDLDYLNRIEVWQKACLSKGGKRFGD
jgi:hypothetical protein